MAIQLALRRFRPAARVRAFCRLLARAVEHLQGIALGHTQHAANVMRLSLRQFMLTKAQRSVDKKAGQSHLNSLKIRVLMWERACSRLYLRGDSNTPRSLHREQARSHSGYKYGPV